MPPFAPHYVNVHVLKKAFILYQHVQNVLMDLVHQELLI